MTLTDGEWFVETHGAWVRVRTLVHGRPKTVAFIPNDDDDWSFDDQIRMAREIAEDHNLMRSVRA